MLVLKVSFKEIRLGFPGELGYTDGLPLFDDLPNGLKSKL